jgi:hypothetical protein
MMMSKVNSISACSTGGSRTSNSKRIIVTLIHGTFARGASWTGPDSRLAQSLKNVIPGVEIRAFKWSGKNMHRARLQAGMELSCDLVDLLEQNPKTLHYIVGHSHAGNVIMYALRELPRQYYPDGIITMGTPFIVTDARDLGPTVKAIRVAIRSFLGLVAILVFVLGLFAFLSEKPSQPYAYVIVSFIGLLYLGAVWFLIRQIISRVNSYTRKKLLTKQKREMSRISLPEIDGVPTLSLYVERDEAGILLRLLDYASELPFRLWQPSLVLIITGVLGVAFAAVYPAIIWLAIVLNPEVRVSYELASQFMLLFAGIIVLVTPLFFLVFTMTFQLIMAIWSRIFRGHALGFGEGNIFQNWLGHVSAIVLPPNIDNVVSRGFKIGGKGLRHSKIYNDASVIDVICKWIAKNVSSSLAADETK